LTKLFWSITEKKQHGSNQAAQAALNPPTRFVTILQ